MLVLVLIGFGALLLAICNAIENRQQKIKETWDWNNETNSWQPKEDDK